jgi:hypothetical protein
MFASILALGLAGGIAAAPSTPLPGRALLVHLIERCVPTDDCLPSTIVTRMKYETERIWSSLDVQIMWIDSLDAGAQTHAQVLTAMLEEDSDPIWPEGRGGAVLGSLHQPPSACGPGLARVWLRRIRRHISAVRLDGHPFDSLPGAFAQILLGRALGRVLAHEIGHYLLGTAEHATHGLMRARFAPQDLLEDARQRIYRLTSGERARLRSCPTNRPADPAAIRRDPPEHDRREVEPLRDGLKSIPIGNI